MHRAQTGPGCRVVWVDRVNGVICLFGVDGVVKVVGVDGGGLGG